MHSSQYIRVSLELAEPLRDWAIALLADAGYEAFEEKEPGLDAYIAEPHFDESELRECLAVMGLDPTAFQAEPLPQRNWNAEWEASFEAIYIDNYCQVIASFKTPRPEFAYTVVIDPKMAFGTGHHETTRLMIRQLSLLDLKGKTVLDMGCGTGILAILAAKMGAAAVTGIDIDPWSYENSVENAEINGVPGVNFLVGDASSIPDVSYDVILANINRNVLLHDVGTYAQHLASGGNLVSSGFLREDVSVIEETFSRAGLQTLKQMSENQWLSISFAKKQSRD